MTLISVARLKEGETLIENVQTKRGSILLNKGKMITSRDIEILKAFLIPAVAIENTEQTHEESDTLMEEPTSSILTFYEKYEAMFMLMNHVFSVAYSGGAIPIAEVRANLEALLSQIHHYHILTFSPRYTSMGEYIYNNSIMISLTSYLLARWYGVEQKDLVPVALAGLLHDIGNVKVPPEILEKPSKLSPDEIEEMKKHTIFGYHLLKNVPAINDGVKLTALQHHEKADGSGYPLGVKSEKIHLYAKIVAVADIFHAMTSNRRYKKAASPYLVLEQLFNESFGKLEPALVQTFINKVTQFHNGVMVKLSDDRVGEIVFSDRANPTRPWVNVDGTIVNLTVERNLYIQHVVH